MLIRGEKAREQVKPAIDLLIEKFGKQNLNKETSAQYVGFEKKQVIGVTGLNIESPLTSVLLEEEGLCDFWNKVFTEGKSVLIDYSESGIKACTEEGTLILDANVSSLISKIIKDAEHWGGILNENGELIADPSTPAPGPHYYTNLLIGNRIGFDRPLQSTPKSAIDRLGGGCFRAHADTQVLATRTLRCSPE